MALAMHQRTERSHNEIDVPDASLRAPSNEKKGGGEGWKSFSETQANPQVFVFCSENQKPIADKNLSNGADTYF